MDNIESNKIAVLTGRAVQDDETFKKEGDFIPERDQFYFEVRQGDHVFLVGLKDMLTCLRLLEKLDEIPKIGEKWWDRMSSLYGDAILLTEHKAIENYEECD